MWGKKERLLSFSRAHLTTGYDQAKKDLKKMDFLRTHRFDSF